MCPNPLSWLFKNHFLTTNLIWKISSNVFLLLILSGFKKLIENNIFCLFEYEQVQLYS